MFPNLKFRSVIVLPPISWYARSSGLVLLGFLASGVPSAMATIISITADSNSPQSVTGMDSLSVSSGVTLTSTTATPAVTWTGSSGVGPTVTNSGTIQNTYNTGSSSGRAIDMNFTSANSGFTLTNGSISNSSALIQSGNDVFRINKPIGSGAVIVNNYGTMQSTGLNGSTNGQAIDFNSNTSTTGTVTINNFATGVMSAADADGIRPGNGATINNWGSIQGNTTGDTGNDGIDFQDPGKSGAVNNYGSTSSITGARHGITAKEAITVYNEGIIQGYAGSGLNIDTTTNSPVMSVTNASTGQIIGNAVSGADGDGIDIDRLATINNSGVIKAVGLSASPNINEAIAIGGGTINNYAGGTIISDQRAITVDDSNLGNAFGAVAVYNEGTITGKDGQAISITSAFANTLTNKGTINGSVVMGNGDDTINLYTGSILNGLLDGGGGTDTIHLLETGSGSLGTISDIEDISVDDGNWTLNIVELLLQNGGDLVLEGGTGAGLSIYAAEIDGAAILGDTITNIMGGDGFNIYYDASNEANGYLGGRVFNLTDGGLLRPLPEPGSIALMLSGLGLLMFTRARHLRM